VYPTIAELVGSVRGYQTHYVYSNPATREPEMIVVRVQDAEARRSFRPVPSKAGS
jgi:hypothetical protein